MTKQLIAFIAFALMCSVSTFASAKSNGDFLKDAIQGNLGEVQIGQLAQQNGSSAEVKDFGKTLVDDHSAANEKAVSLAQTKGMTPPTEPKPEAKKLYDKLSKLSGEQFDREFKTAMIADHKKDIAEFEREAKGNDDVAQFASGTLPTLKKHLQIAESLPGGAPAKRS